jgi:hypothetical protein
MKLLMKMNPKNGTGYYENTSLMCSSMKQRAEAKHTGLRSSDTKSKW